VSRSWGTLRFGRLAEVLLYDVRRSCTFAGPSAVFIDPSVEKWLVDPTVCCQQRLAVKDGQILFESDYASLPM
jgi:hypothetical protein